MESIVGKVLCDRYRIIQELSPRLYGSPLIELCQTQDFDSDTPETTEAFVEDDFCQVYVAEDRSQNSPVQCIIERLQPRYDNEVLGSGSWQKVFQTFIAQANLLQKISHHPQIPRLWDFFECDREFYLVYEQIKGQSLEQKLDSILIDETEAIIWLREILAILRFSHQLGVAHLNIQPSSLVQHQDGRKFLINFTVLKKPIILDALGTKNTIDSHFADSEQRLNLGYRADIYTLGKTIIWALTGNFASSIQLQSLDFKKFQEKENSSRSSLVNISSELANILNKMVGEDPEHCYQCVDEVLAELDFEQNVITFPPPFLGSPHLSSLRSKKSRNKRPKNKENNQIKADKIKVKYSRIILWLLLTLPFAIATIIIFIGINKNSYKKFTNYVNNDYQFSLKYPQHWSQRQIDDPITGEVVVFNSPLETDTDLFREKVYIAVEYLPTRSTNLEQYTQTVFERIYQTKGSDIEVYEDYKTSIDKFPAHRVIYSRQEGELLLRQMETFTIRNNQVYIAIYTAERAKFSKFYNNVEKIIDSWEIQ